MVSCITLLDSADQPEVQKADHVARTIQHQHVPRVGIAVEDPVLEQLAKAPVDEVGHHLLAVVEGPIGVGDLGAAQALHREHRPAGQLLVDLGDADVGALRVILREGAEVRGFALEVELLVQGAVELLHDAAGSVDARLLEERLQRPGKVVEEVDVGADRLADLGLWTLITTS